MIKSLFKILSLGLVVVSFASCNDVLDETPDNRTDIDTPEKVKLLLTSGYPQSVPAVICELSGDNLVDNNVVVPSTHNDPYSAFHEETYKWEDINNYSTSEQDTPYAVWEAYFGGIAVCNHAIEAIEEMAEERGTTPQTDTDLSPAWGEAHVLRAYLHFMLSTIFAEAYKDSTQSQNDMAIPYVTDPETTVNVDYGSQRKTVKELYDLIEADILEGINYIDDASYTVPAYHFNQNAANAFAARFYLAKREYEKVVQYATAALGSNPSSSLRNWANISTNTISAQLNGYNDESVTANFLIQDAYSLQDRMLSACRYAINTGSTTYGVPDTQDILYSSGPNWSSRLPAYDGRIFIWSAGQEYGIWLFNVYEYFEYTDKIAGIGYVHILYHPFTAEETLLCRAEAELYLGNIDAAISDLGYWTSSKQVTTALDLSSITTFYGNSRNSDYLSDIHPQEMSSEFKTLTQDEEYVLQCILHFRRIETMFEGLRWFDIKRYGINVHHAYRGAQEYNVTEDDLTWDDPRRVLQIPNNVITAGYPSTDRTSNDFNQNSSMTSNPILAK
ncbi:MAG: RagB/SusD family nutrient uptake outer membrane protein [Prevotellaceae bacterium]|nr:RagB/SusD family nutrient uptake outer membrane protein [Prevotellaceae bacterium]